MIAYSLNKDISCEEVCKQMQRMFQKLRDQGVDISNKVMTINIVDVIQTTDVNVPKLEYQPE
jgi:hypothetical protein